MNRREGPNVTVWDREGPPDWRSGCVTLIIAFALGLLIGIFFGLNAAPRSVQVTTPPPAPTGSDDAQANALRPTVSVATVRPSASPELSGAPSRRPTPTGQELAMTSGIASHMGDTQGSGYLALPEGRGSHVRICGERGCVNRTSTDAGPDLEMQRAGRIADLYVGDFELICGPRTLGTCHVTVEYR
jgi:hypothetical protein